MPEVAHGDGAWDAAELAHLSSCASCAAEWQLVSAGVALGAGLRIDSAAIADQVVERLRRERDVDRPVRRIPWRAGAIGLIVAAAAAIVMVTISRTPDHASTSVTAPADAPVAILPELQNLDEQQLEAVQQSLGPSASDATPGLTPHLGDLTEGELEDLLRSEGEGGQ
jgi:hypothetical protein